MRTPLIACVAELAERGIHLSRGAVQNHFKLLKAGFQNLRVKPKLKRKHKIARLEYILDQVDLDHGYVRADHKFHDQLDTVHVDESWFYITTVDRSVLVWDAIAVPDSPTVTHKSHILKVMFLVAMGRPQTRPDGTWFDGKIGLWECTEQVLTKRASVNRPAGVYETKPRSIDSIFYHELCTKPGGLIATVKEKMAWRKHTGIVIQHDGAGPHNGKGNTAALTAAGLANGWHIKFRTQPAQSPDLNIMDLGFFHSLKARASHLKMDANNLPELIAKVKEAFAQYPWQTLQNIWAHQIECWRIILQVDGDNQYPQLHGGARRRVKAGGSAVNLSVDVDEYNRVIAMLDDE